MNEGGRSDEKPAGVLATTGGRPLEELTLANVLAGTVDESDVGIRPAVLRHQGTVARGAGRDRLADNFERGAELVGVPDEEIFATYEKLRPGRARSRAELIELARHYRQTYGAHRIAELIESAAEVYERRRLFQKRF